MTFIAGYELRETFDVRSFGAVGDGETDDTAACQAAVAAASVAGGSVTFPPGRYLLDGGSSHAGTAWGLAVTSSRVRLVGRHATLVRTIDGATVFAFGGDVDDWTSWRTTDATLYDCASVAKGAVTVTLDSEEDAAQFAAGDKLYIRTGQLTANPLAWPEPDAETFTVVAVDGVTVTLDRPTGKPYAQEYYVSGTSGVTSTTPTANPAPFGVANVTDRFISDITIEGLRFESASEVRNVITAWQVENLSILGCTGVGAAGFQTGRDLVGCRIERNTFHGYGTATTMPYMLSGASGVSDMTDIDNIWTAEGFRFAHINEGTVRFHSRGSRYLNGIAEASDAAISIRSRSYGCVIEDPTVVNAGYAVFIESSCTDGGTIRNVMAYGAIGTSVIRVDPVGWRIDQSDVPTGLNSLGPAGTGAGPTPTHTISAWVQHNTSARTIGWLPGRAVITGIVAATTVAWDGSPTIDVGISGDAARYADNITGLGTLGAGTVPGGAGANRGPWVPSRQLCIATVTAGGATTGKTLIAVSYALASTQP